MYECIYICVCVYMYACNLSVCMYFVTPIIKDKEAISLRRRDGEIWKSRREKSERRNDVIIV